MNTNQEIIQRLILCFKKEEYTGITIETLYKMTAEDLKAMVTIAKAIFDCQPPNHKTTKSASIDNIRYMYNASDLQQVFYPIHSRNRKETQEVYETLRKQLNIQSMATLPGSQTNINNQIRSKIQLLPSDLTNLKPMCRSFKLLLYVGVYDITKQKTFLQGIDIRPKRDLCYVAIFHQLKYVQMQGVPEQTLCKFPMAPRSRQIEMLYINGNSKEFSFDGSYQIIRLDQLNEEHEAYEFDVECVQYELDHRSHRQFCSIYLAKYMKLDEQFQDIFKRPTVLPARMYKYLKNKNALTSIEKLVQAPISVFQENKDGDDDFEIDATQLIPICQIKKGQIMFPVIGRKCSHWDVCMDLATYMEQNVNQCYICNNPVTYDDLMVHVLFYHIQKQNISKLVINNEGEELEMVTQEDGELSGWS